MRTDFDRERYEPLARIPAPTHSPPDLPILANILEGEKRFMKLVRFGAPGREKPGIIDGDGRIRDLSKVVPDIAGETLSQKGLNKIKKTDVSKLPVVKAGTRLGPCV